MLATLLTSMLTLAVVVAQPVAGVLGGLTVRNSILSNGDEFPELSASVAVTYSAVKGTTVPAGVGNKVFLVDDAHFDQVVAPQNSFSYYLSPNSDFTNQGQNNALLPEKDINGNDRTYDTTVDIGAIEYSLVYEKGVDNWNSPSHWNIGRIPTELDVVSVRSNSVVNTVDAVAKKIIEIKENVSLTINADKMLVVSETINNTVPERLIIKSSASAEDTLANGTLIYHNDVSNPVWATVEMFTISSWDLTRPVNQKYSWQFFGIPIEPIQANPTFSGAYVRELDEAGTSIQTHWVQLTNNSELIPFKGYELCYETPRVISFKGKLVNRDFHSGQLVKSQGEAIFPGQHLFANPYTAAIDIRDIEMGEEMDQTVFLYNTGSFEAWSATGGNPVQSDIRTPGVYNAVPILLASQGGLLGQVPSMGSLLVHILDAVFTPTAESYLAFNYSSVAMKNNDKQRAPSMDLNKCVSTMITVNSEFGMDRMWLFSNDHLSRSFDNGCDGVKMMGPALTPQIFAVEEDGKYQVNAVDDMNNTVLAFQAGQDTQYKMYFNHQNLDQRYTKLYLHDLSDNTITDITEDESSYAFTAMSTPQPVNRFRIIARSAESEQSTESDKLNVFTGGDNIYIENLTADEAVVYLYDLTGRLKSQKALHASSALALPAVLNIGHILKTVFATENIINKLMITN